MSPSISSPCSSQIHRQDIKLPTYGQAHPRPHSFIPFHEKGPLLLLLLSQIHFACQQHFNVFHFFALVSILDGHQQYPSFHYVVVSGLLCNLFATLCYLAHHPSVMAVVVVLLLSAINKQFPVVPTLSSLGQPASQAT